MNCMLYGDVRGRLRCDRPRRGLNNTGADQPLATEQPEIVTLSQRSAVGSVRPSQARDFLRPAAWCVHRAATGRLVDAMLARIAIREGWREMGRGSDLASFLL